MNGNIRALIINDSLDEENLFKCVLEKGNFQLNTKRVESLLHFISLLKKSKWDVIIANNSLNEFSLNTIVAAIKDSRKEIPFIIVSNKIDDPPIFELLSNGAAEFAAIKWLSWNSFPYPEENLIIGVARDITEKMGLDESLRLSKEHYQLIDEASNDLISSFDRQGRFTHANSAMCKFLGLSLEQILGNTHVELGLPPEECKEWDRLLLQVNETDTTVIAETSTINKNSDPQYFDVVLNPIHNETGEIIGIAATSRDINARKQAEIKIQEQLDELRRWNAVTLGRESRILELKQEVNQLLIQQKQSLRYGSGNNLESPHD